MLRSTHVEPQLREGSIVLDVGYLDDDNQLHELVVDVDSFAVELAVALLQVVLHQRDSEGVT